MSTKLAAFILSKHRSHRRWGVALSVTALTISSLAGCASGNATTDTLKQITKNGVVRVGFANEAPFAYSTPDGKLAGFMPAAMSYIFSQIGGIKLEGVLAEFSGLIPGVQANRFDVVGAGLYINSKRCGQALPSNPIYTAAEGFAVLAGNPKELHSYADLLKSGVTFGTVSGSINLSYATSAGVTEKNVKLFPDVPSALAALEAGRVDAVGMSAISLQNVLSNTKSSAVELADPFTAPKGANAYGAVYFKKGDNALANEFNTKLAEAIKSGELLKVYEQAGFGKELLPPVGITADTLCKA